MYWKSIQASEALVGVVVDNDVSYGRVTSVQKRKTVDGIELILQISQCRPVVILEGDQIMAYGFHGTQAGKLA